MQRVFCNVYIDPDIANVIKNYKQYRYTAQNRFCRSQGDFVESVIQYCIDNGVIEKESN